MGYSIVLFVYELIELITLFTGYTIFQNKLSIFQILFHVITVILYIFYIFFDWKGDKIWVIFFFGTLIPLLFEGGGMFYSYLFYTKVLRLN